MLLIHCLLLLPLFVCVCVWGGGGGGGILFSLCCAVLCIVSSFATILLEKRESGLLCVNCLLDVMWLLVFCVSSSLCCGLLCVV